MLCGTTLGLFSSIFDDTARAGGTYPMVTAYVHRTKCFQFHIYGR